MINKLIYGGIAALIFMSAIYLYGESRHAQGRAEAAQEYSDIAAASQRSMLIARDESNRRILAVNKLLEQQKREHDENVRHDMRKDASYAAWRAVPVHPVAVDRYRRLRESANDSGRLPGR